MISVLLSPDITDHGGWGGGGGVSTVANLPKGIKKSGSETIQKPDKYPRCLVYSASDVSFSSDSWRWINQRHLPPLP